MYVFSYDITKGHTGSVNSSSTRHVQIFQGVLDFEASVPQRKGAGELGIGSSMFSSPTNIKDKTIIDPKMFGYRLWGFLLRRPEVTEFTGFH